VEERSEPAGWRVSVERAGGVRGRGRTKSRDLGVSSGLGWMSRIETARTLGHSLVGALGKDERRERDLALDGLEAREGRPGDYVS
jgi:hypothetical protein